MIGDLVGNVMAGGELDPPVENIGMSDAGGGQIRVELEVLVGNGTAGHEVAVYSDGLHAFSVSADQVATEAGPFAEGTHDVDLVVYREEWAATPRFLVDRQGRRALVRWEPVSATDCVAYRVYHDDATGTVDYNTLIATVDEVEAETFLERAPDSGSGTGRLSLVGAYNGETVNATWSIKITSSGFFDYNTGGGYTGTPLEFTPGLTRSLLDGLSVCFPDALGAYAVNDTWSFHVGPRQWYASEELDPGTYKFGIKAVDLAGNVSTAGTAVPVVVTGEPDPVSAVAASYDVGDEEVTITWTDAADTDSVNIYASWDSTFGDLADHILVLKPLATVASGTETWTYSIPADSGTVRFYVRAVNAAGIEEQNFSIIEADTATEPASSIVGSPFNLAGVVGPAGVAILTWSQDTRDGVPTHWRIFTFTSEPDAADFAAASPTQVAVSFDSFIGDIATDSYTTGALGGQRWFGVRAVDANGAEDGNVAFVTVTPDSTAPSAVVPIGGGGI